MSVVCKTCGGLVPDGHVPSIFDPKGVGHPHHATGAPDVFRGSAHKKQDEELREKLAAIEHDRWSSWVSYMFMDLGTMNEDGTFTIHAWSVEKQKRQATTPYLKLSRDEQLADLREVDRYWPLVHSHANEARKDEARRNYTTLVRTIQVKRDDPNLMWHELHEPLADRIAELESQESES